MDPMRVYQYSNPGRLIFGPGSLTELKKEISAKERPLVVTDQGVVQAGILKRVTDLLADAGIRYELFDRGEQTRRLKWSSRRRPCTKKEIAHRSSAWAEEVLWIQQRRWPPRAWAW